MIVQDQFVYPSEGKTLFTGDVCEIEKDERPNSEPWEIISIEVNDMEQYTPDQIIEIGKQFIALGERVKKQYTQWGHFKKISHQRAPRIK